MIKKILISYLLFAGSLTFANDQILIEKIRSAQTDIQNQSIPIGLDAKQFTNYDDAFSFIKNQCTDTLENYQYLGDKELVKNVVFPNCLEYAIEEYRK